MRKAIRKSRKAVGKSMIHLAIAAASVGGGGYAKAQTKHHEVSVTAHKKTEAVREERFRESIDAFAAADRLNAPKQGGVLFVGSSTIRMWDTLENQFEKLPVVVRRGFGGSRLSDCNYYLSNLVLPYKPSLVVVYAGDNDLNEGATPEEVLASFTDFVAGVRKELPDTRIAYVSIKPSPSRAGIMQASRETNALIEQFSHQVDNLDYIDIYSAMLNADGQPRGELFLQDKLHMNAKGYALWQTIITPHVMPYAPPDRYALPAPPDRYALPGGV
jgi:lysophospholipase L1-like esterase